MEKYDLILIHPPNILSIKEKQTSYNAFCSSGYAIAVTNNFEMYPIGLKAIKNYLITKEMKVKIINLASEILSGDNFNLHSFIRKHDSAVYGIGAHWFFHLPSAIELASMIKKNKSKSKVLLGGFTASYFAEGLISHKDIDFIIKGAYTLNSIYQTLKEIKNGKSRFAQIPDLVWKNDKKEIQVNKPNRLSKRIDKYEIDWTDYIDGFNERKTLEKPLIHFVTAIGCPKNCAYCGGSTYFFRKHFNNKEGVSYRSLASVFRELESLSHSKKPVNIYSVGFWHEEDKYLYPILKKMKKSRVGTVSFELWDLIPVEKAVKIAEYVNPVFILTPESSELAVGKACGRGSYSMTELELWLERILTIRGVDVQIWFMIGLPKQTEESVRKDIEFCKRILSKYGSKNVNTLITPLTNLDPGSVAYDNPQKYGYEIFESSAFRLSKLLSAPSWKHQLNYQTKWLTRDEIMNLSYDAMYELARKKHELGLLPLYALKDIEKNINISRKIVEEIDYDLNHRGSLSDAIRTKIEEENKRREKDNSCVLYNFESSLRGKWFFHSYC